MVRLAAVRASPHLCCLVSPALSPQGAPKGDVTPVPPFLQLSEKAGVGQHPIRMLADQGHGCGVLSQPLQGCWGFLPPGWFGQWRSRDGRHPKAAGGRKEGSPGSVCSLQRALMQKEIHAWTLVGEREPSITHCWLFLSHNTCINRAEIRC